MNTLLRDSLRYQELCPKCGVSWAEIEDSLHEPVTSQNRIEAELIIANCPVCQERFKGVEK